MRLLAVLFLGLAGVGVGYVIAESGTSRSEPVRWVPICETHCAEYADFSFSYRHTFEGSSYAYCKCLDDWGVVSDSVLGVNPDGSVSGETPVRRTAERDQRGREAAAARANERLAGGVIEKRLDEGARLLKELERLRGAQEKPTAE